MTAPDTPYPIAGVEEFYIPNEERVLAGCVAPWGRRHEERLETPDIGEGIAEVEI